MNAEKYRDYRRNRKWIGTCDLFCQPIHSQNSPPCEGSMPSPAGQHRSKTQKASGVASQPEPIANSLMTLTMRLPFRPRCSQCRRRRSCKFLPSSVLQPLFDCSACSASLLSPNICSTRHCCDTDSSGAVHLSQLTISEYFEYATC